MSPQHDSKLYDEEPTSLNFPRPAPSPDSLILSHKRLTKSRNYQDRSARRFVLEEYLDSNKVELTIDNLKLIDDPIRPERSPKIVLASQLPALRTVDAFHLETTLPGFPRKFPTLRRPVKLPLSTESNQVIDKWYDGCKITLGKLLPAPLVPHVKRLLYTYRELNATELEDIPATDLYKHEVFLRPGTIPWKDKRQRRYTPFQQVAINKILEDGINSGFYERPLDAQGRFSDWNSSLNPVPKDKSLPDDHPDQVLRITVDYSHIDEVSPGTTMELAQEVHDYMANPAHKVFCIFDIKHGYWNVELAQRCREYFAFVAPGIGQLQPTRMQQGSKTSSFGFNELMHIALGAIPALPLDLQTADSDGSFPSLLTSPDYDGLPDCKFYIDDIGAGKETAEQMVDFLQNHFFPRILWSQLKFSFQKLQLFCDEVTMLGTCHKIGGVVQVKKSRADKIRDFPVPTDKSGVRSFLATIGICRPFVKNFSHIAKPLNRLTQNDTLFQWKAPQQLAFQFLRDMSADQVELYGVDHRYPTQMYTDASKYGGGCVIVQRRPSPTDPGRSVEYPILFDSMTFTKTQRNYGTYKRELLTMVEYARKYHYHFQHQEKSTFFTDHKPLVYFLKSTRTDGIYARWAQELRELNIEIVHIPGKRNRVSDALSRTVFPDDFGQDDEVLYSCGDMVSVDGGTPTWVWKDGKGGYEELLRLRKISEEDAAVAEAKSAQLILAAEDADPTIAHLMDIAYNIEFDVKNATYSTSDWYSDIYNFITRQVYPPSVISKLDKARFFRKCCQYKMHGDVLFFCVGGGVEALHPKRGSC